MKRECKTCKYVGQIDGGDYIPDGRLYCDRFERRPNLYDAYTDRELCNHGEKWEQYVPRPLWRQLLPEIMTLAVIVAFFVGTAV